MSEEEAALVLGMYFRAESVPKILDERIPGFGGRTVREIAQHRRFGSNGNGPKAN